MIDWNKPIETVDGRKARVIETHRQELWRLVWVEAEFEGPGDVYLVNAEGCRCDSRSIEMGLQMSQFIRNVRVKRKAWIRLAIHDFYKGETKEEIEKYITKSGYKAVYCEWEE